LGSNVAHGVRVEVHEGVSVIAEFAFDIGASVFVALISVGDGIIVSRVGWIVELSGEHPTKATRKIHRRSK